jgi:hypothetical protein
MRPLEYGTPESRYPGRAGGAVRLDVPAGHAGAARWLAGRGVLPVGSDPVMSYEGRALPGDRDLVYGLFMQALG